MAQDDYFYEIQLSNKQLVFYFMALATGLIMSFLAGVMVGRGVEDRGPELTSSRPAVEERAVAEEKPRTTLPTPGTLTYAQRLEVEKSEDALEKPLSSPPKPALPRGASLGETKAIGPGREEGAPGRETSQKSSPRPETAVAGPGASGSVSPKPVASPIAEKARNATDAAAPSVGVSIPPPKPSQAPLSAGASPALPATLPGGYAIQVGAFRDRAAADSVVARLRGKGFDAHVVAPGASEGLFNVRVGPFAARTEAEEIQGRLRDEEKLKPFLVRQ